MRIVLKPAGLFIVLLAMGILGIAAFRANTPEAVPAVQTPAVVETPPPPANLAANADMSASGANGFPEAWEHLWSAENALTAGRDETESHSAPASLILDTGGKQGTGQIGQRFPVQPGERYKISGYLKSNATGTWSLAVQFYNADSQPVDFQHVGATTPEGSWRFREAEVTVPKGASLLGVLLFADGNGKAWLDDVSVTRVP